MALNITELPGFQGFNLSELSNISITDYYLTIKPLIFFIIGITIYAVFIFKFYRLLSRRDVTGLGLYKYEMLSERFFERLGRVFFYILENLILIPIFVFFWFAVMVIFLLILTRNPIPNNILLASVSLVAAVRITAYINENLSQDLAKMIPFALLGIFLIDASYFSVGASLSFAKQFLSLWKLGIYYLLFVISLEVVLRGLYSFFRFLFPEEGK